MNGHATVARILVSRGADVSIVSKLGATALLVSAQLGHVGVTEVLIKAGSDLEAMPPSTGATPLHLAAEKGHWEVMRLLIEAGADVDSRCSEGEYRTPLLLAAEKGHVKAARELLRAEANPLMPWTFKSGETFLPLDTAARKGRLGVMNEMIRLVGIEGCGGASGGVDALGIAAVNNRVDTMAILTDAGVVDTGEALVQAAGFGGVAFVKFLLQQQQQQGRGKSTGVTPLVSCIKQCRSFSPKVVRLLVDFGADTTTAVPATPGELNESLLATPLAMTNVCLEGKRLRGKDADEQQLNTLKAVRRLLLQVEAVHAVSWLWHNGGAPPIPNAAAEGARRITTPSTPLLLMMPTLRRRAARRGVLLAALYRQSSKP